MKNSIVGISKRELYLHDVHDKTLKIQALRPAIHVDVFVTPDAPPTTVTVHHAQVCEWNKFRVLKLLEAIQKKNEKLLALPHAGWRGRMQQALHHGALKQLDRDAAELLGLLIKSTRIDVKNEPELLVQKVKLKLTTAALVGAGYFYYY